MGRIQVRSLNGSVATKKRWSETDKTSYPETQYEGLLQTDRRTDELLKTWWEGLLVQLEKHGSGFSVQRLNEAIQD